MTTNPLCTWDFTVGEEYVELDVLKTWLNDNCKKWTFQLELGQETFFKHYQGRISLKEKVRKVCKIVPEIHFSATSNANKENDFYVMKSETKVGGPWKDSDKEVYIPRQIREITELRPWQKQVVEKSKPWDTRHINLIYSPNGNEGKSILKGWMRAYGLATPLPFCNDFKDIMRMVMDMPTSKCYIIDIPRAINKERLFQLYAAIESIKDGYAYDDRYSFKDKYFDCPNVWVFTNKMPEKSEDLLSPDRWIIYGIDEEQKLFLRRSVDL